MSNKDFLDQFSSKNQKPDSFKEEERVKITKERKPVNVKLLIIVVLGLLLVAGIVLFIIFRPTIEVLNFVGSDSSEVTAWIRQNEIETKGVVFKEEYSFDYDKGIVVSQSEEEGKKVRKDAKLTFVISLGADPDELVSLPDIKSMNKQEIQDWIKENKLTKTKIVSTYSDTVPDGEVISYDLKGVDENQFTRSSTLNITISKGEQPAGTVTVPDFINKYYSEVETWAKSNKIELSKVENYSDKVAKDYVISQSVEAKKEMKEGETLTVYVSLGKGIKVPNFASMSKNDVDSWLEENSAYCKINKKHSSSEDYIIDQSISAGNFIGTDNKLHITINLGNYFYLDEIGMTLVGNSYDKFKDLSYELVEKGIYIDTHKTWVASDKPAGTILNIESIKHKDTSYSEIQRLPLDVDITCRVSDGSGANKFKFVVSDFTTVQELDNWINENGQYELNYLVDGSAPVAADMAKTISEIKDADGNPISGEVMLSYGTTINVIAS